MSSSLFFFVLIFTYLSSLFITSLYPAFLPYPHLIPSDTPVLRILFVYLLTSLLMLTCLYFPSPFTTSLNNSFLPSYLPIFLLYCGFLLLLLPSCIFSSFLIFHLPFSHFSIYFSFIFSSVSFPLLSLLLLHFSCSALNYFCFVLNFSFLAFYFLTLHFSFHVFSAFVISFHFLRGVIFLFLVSSFSSLSLLFSCLFLLCSFMPLLYVLLAPICVFTAIRYCLNFLFLSLFFFLLYFVVFMCSFSSLSLFL